MRKWIVAVRAPLVCVSVLVFMGCAQEEPTSSDEAPVEQPAATVGTLRGTISYAGTKTGVSVRVAAFREFPPKSPPVAAQTYTTVAFPLSYELAVPAGTYKAMAFLDITGDTFTPGPDDAISGAYEATVSPGGTTVTDMTIE